MGSKHRGGGGMTTKAQFEQAYLAGIAARQVGRKRDSCPTWALGEQGALWREQWRRGWDDEDARRRK